MKGSIVREYTVWCGGDDCIERRRSMKLTQPEAVREYRNAGWSRTLHLGWLCPACAAKRREA